MNSYHYHRVWQFLQRTGRRILAVGCLIAAIVILVQAGLPSRTVVFGMIDLPDRRVSIAAEVGSFAPPIQADTIRGTQLDTGIRVDMPTILNFWASWCAPCATEMPALQTIHATGSARVIGIGVDESIINSLSWSDTYNLTFPLISDQTGRLAATYSIRVLPTTVFIRPDGTIAAIRVGALNLSELTDLVTPSSMP